MTTKKGLFFLSFFCLSFSFFAQEYSLSGKIVDETGTSVPFATVQLKGSNKGATTDEEGKFTFKKLPSGKHTFIVRFTNFIDKTVTLDLVSDTVLATPWQLEAISIELEGVQVVGRFVPHKIEKIETISTDVVHNDYIRKNLGGSLIQTLEKLPGIKSMSIGSSSSKPLIRGLGFNEVAVIEDGIKHEGQQWGADHGLEIDQFNSEMVEIVKGPSSFLYGSDAVGGVIVIHSTSRPLKNTSGGSLDLIGKSNNSQFGSSLHLYTAKNKWYIDGRLTYLDYADYTVPTQTIYPYNYAVNLHKNKVRNTAGKEFNKFIRTGYVGENFSSELYVSNYHNREGSFANAHGLEPMKVDEELHDASNRDILLPHNKVSHTKIINRAEWKFEKYKLNIDIGFQNNFRQEHSPYISHGYMPSIYPSNRPTSSDLEMEYKKNVYSANIKNNFKFHKHDLTFGINGEIQQNKIQGWGFLIPEFQNYKLGGFVYDKWNINKKWLLLGALRYDFGRIEIEEYKDWFLSDTDENTEPEFLMRAPNFSKNFHSLVYALGMQYKVNRFTWTSNIGKSFRMPLANELAANGVNYDYFRYEKGNTNLDPEESYQIDIGLDWNAEKIHLRFTPFANYFSNFIYLNPTANYDTHYGAGNQIFNYTQAAVFRTGLEIAGEWEITDFLELSANGEYIYNRQLTGDKKGYTLPFTPPLAGIAGLTYSPTLFSKKLADNFLKIETKWAAEQTNIVPPEEKTPGYFIWNFSVGTKVKMKNDQNIQITFNINNLFNTKYFEHTNYYRIIQLPEQGRNFILSVNIPFFFQHKTP